MLKIRNRLFELQDLNYLEFHSKLIPSVDKKAIIGVRIPILRKLAKEYIKDPESDLFLKDLPHKYYDENILHALLISEIKDYDLCIKYLEEFLPYIDNWAVCDILSPKVFKKHKEELLVKIKEWSTSKQTYVCRFGIGMLMSHYLDFDYKKGYLEIPTLIHLDDYYINMMIAWFFATALAKRWEDTIVYLEENKLDVWVHNKTIQKACESYRITPEKKKYLKTLKV